MLRPTAALIAGTAALFLLVGCTPVRPDAVKLSAEIGVRIASARAAHFALVHSYFEQRRQRVDEFIEREYLPWKVNNVFGARSVNAAFRRECKSQSADCTELLLGLGLRVTQPTERQRIEIQRRLDALEAQLKNKLDAHYSQTALANARLTTLLDHASKARIDAGALLRGLSTAGSGLLASDVIEVGEILDTAEQVTDLVTAAPQDFDGALKPVDALLRRVLPQATGVRRAN
mgnify:CR=1 FL=1